MPLTDNTWTNALADGNGNAGGNWSLGHVPTATERMYVDTSGVIDTMPVFHAPVTVTVGAIFWKDGLGVVFGGNDVTCLGDVDVEGTGQSLSIGIDRVDGAITMINTGGTNSDIGVSKQFNGTMTVPIACDYMDILGGTGTVIFDGYAPLSTIGVDFTGTLVANAVIADLDESVLSPSVTLQTLNGGSFTNYTVAPGPASSHLSLGMTLGL